MENKYKKYKENHQTTSETTDDFKLPISFNLFVSNYSFLFIYIHFNELNKKDLWLLDCLSEKKTFD